MSDKIKPHHVERKAILYVRQSSAFQVQNNLESQKLQYAMRDRLCSLGWRDIEVVDEDLGRTASGTVTRAGFERMVAEVCLGHVGAVAALLDRDDDEQGPWSVMTTMSGNSAIMASITCRPRSDAWAWYSESGISG